MSLSQRHPCLKGVLAIFGGVFGEEEYEKQDGSIGVNVKLVRIIPLSKLRASDFTVPKKKEIKKSNKNSFTTFADAGASVISDEDLPF